VDDIHNSIAQKNPTLDIGHVSNFLDDFVGQLDDMGMKAPQWLKTIMNKYGVREVDNGFTIYGADGGVLLKQSTAGNNIKFNSLLNMVMMFKNSFTKSISQHFDTGGNLKALNSQWSVPTNAAKALIKKFSAYAGDFSDDALRSLESAKNELVKRGGFLKGTRDALDATADDITIKVGEKARTVRGIGRPLEKLEEVSARRAELIKQGADAATLKAYDKRVLTSFADTHGGARLEQLFKRDKHIKAVTGMRNSVRQLASDVLKGAAIIYGVERVSKSIADKVGLDTSVELNQAPTGGGNG